MKPMMDIFGDIRRGVRNVVQMKFFHFFIFFILHMVYEWLADWVEGGTYLASLTKLSGIDFLFFGDSQSKYRFRCRRVGRERG